MLFIEIVTVILKFILCVALGIAAMYSFYCIGMGEFYSLNEVLRAYVEKPREILCGTLAAIMMITIIVLYFTGVTYIITWEVSCLNLF